MILGIKDKLDVTRTAKKSSFFYEYLQTANQNYHTLLSYFFKIKDTTHSTMITLLRIHAHRLEIEREEYTKQIDPTVVFLFGKSFLEKDCSNRSTICYITC